MANISTKTRLSKKGNPKSDRPKRKYTRRKPLLDKNEPETSARTLRIPINRMRITGGHIELEY